MPTFAALKEARVEWTWAAEPGKTVTLTNPFPQPSLMRVTVDTDAPPKPNTATIFVAGPGLTPEIDWATVKSLLARETLTIRNASAAQQTGKATAIISVG
jgi:hypothetical protein